VYGKFWVMAVFTVCTPRQIVLGDQTNGNKLDGACGTQEIEKKRVQSGKTLRKESALQILM
jgi:hypothetical protein